MRLRTLKLVALSLASVLVILGIFLALRQTNRMSALRSSLEEPHEVYFGPFKNPSWIDHFLSILGLQKSLRVQYFYNADAGLGDALARFDGIHTLFLWEDVGRGLITPQQSPEILEGIAQIQSLKHLRIGGYWVTDAAVTNLTGHCHLESLILRDTQVTPAVFPTFTSIKTLQFLDISGTGISLSEAERLQSLLKSTTIHCIDVYGKFDAQDAQTQ